MIAALMALLNALPVLGKIFEQIWGEVVPTEAQEEQTVATQIQSESDQMKKTGRPDAAD